MWVKWWKDKTILMILIIGLIAMGLSLISALLIPSAYCLCAIIPICGIAGIVVRLVINKRIEKINNNS